MVVMLSSSNLVVSGTSDLVSLGRHGSVSLFDTIAAVDLFEDDSNRLRLFTPPTATCKTCHGYFNATSLIQGLGREWVCGMCQTMNHSDVDLHFAPESKAAFVDFVTPSSSSEPLGSSTSTKTATLNIIAFDSRLIDDDEAILKYLAHCFSASSDKDEEIDEEQFVALIFFDKVIRIPRLANLSNESVFEIDIFANKFKGSRWKSPTSTSVVPEALLQRGLHIVSRSTFRNCLWRIQEVIDTIKAIVKTPLKPTTKNSRPTPAFFDSRIPAPVDGVLSIASLLYATLKHNVIQSVLTIHTNQSLQLSSSLPQLPTGLLLNLLHTSQRFVEHSETLLSHIRSSGGLWLSAEDLASHEMRVNGRYIMSSPWQRRAGQVGLTSRCLPFDIYSKAGFLFLISCAPSFISKAKQNIEH